MPMVVVFPTPLTPMTRMTDGLVEMCREESPSIMSATISFISSLTPSPSATPRSFTPFLSREQISSEGATPTSDMIKVSSSSSKSSSSMGRKELKIRSTFCIIDSFVFFSPSLIF